MLLKPIGELDQDDSNVVRHGQEHLPDVFGLLLLVAVGAELGQLGDAVHQLGYYGPESLFDVVEGVVRVPQGHRARSAGGYGRRVDADVGQDLRGGQRVSDVRLAGDPRLIAMGLLGEIEGVRAREPVRSVLRDNGRLASEIAERAEAAFQAGWIPRTAQPADRSAIEQLR